jgi:hypothetical protein
MKGKRIDQRLVIERQMMEPFCMGICVNCIHNKTCTYPITSQRLFCEEYEIN